MTLPEPVLGEPVVERLGWALLHFVWQGARVAIVLAAALRVLRRATASRRYAVACAAMFLMIVLPITTPLRSEARAPVMSGGEQVKRGVEAGRGDVNFTAPQKGTSYTRRYRVDGFELDAGFTPDKGECILGEPMFITFSVKNVSDKAYSFFVGGDIRGSVRHNKFRITAADADGQPVKDPYSHQDFGGRGKDVVLQPGESYTERLYLGYWCAFEKPGIYEATCKRTLDMDGHGEKYPTVPIVTTFKFTIHPFDKEKMGGVIAALGKKLGEGDEQAVYEATLGLAAIDDEEVVPHLALSLTKGDYRNRQPAVEGLSRFPTDAAAGALIVALKDPDYAVAQAAGAALRKMNKTDTAVETLLKELRSPLSSERALAARALGYAGSERALDPLIKAMDDAKLAVGQAAAEAVGHLGDKRALAPLRKRAEGADMGLRVGAAKGLLAMGEPLQVGWLTPVIRNTTDINDQNFHESIRLIRLYGGEHAAPALVSCLNFDDPSPRNAYNMFLILAIEYSPDGPKYYSKFHHDPNTDGTPEQIQENREILAALKAWLAEFERKEKEKRPPGDAGAGVS